LRKAATRCRTKHPYEHIRTRKGTWFWISVLLFDGGNIAVDFGADADFSDNGFMPHDCTSPSLKPEATLLPAYLQLHLQISYFTCETSGVVEARVVV
jgi:hypothetical protein